MKFAALIFALALPLGAQVTISGNSGGGIPTFVLH